MTIVYGEQDRAPTLIEELYARSAASMDVAELERHRRYAVERLRSGDQHAAAEVLISGLVAGLRAEEERSRSEASAKSGADHG